MQKEKRPAAFLDRDGVLNEEIGFITQKNDIHIFPFAKDCVDTLRDMGYWVIVITNQSGIAKGKSTIEQVNENNEFVKQQTGVDAIYFCPHNPKGIIKKYAIECDCRKPKTGLIEQAKKDFDIDMSRSFFVGDRASDIETGKNAGVKTVLVETGYGSARLEYPIEPDYICNDLREVIGILKDMQGGKK